jgi:hypothetical protein
MDSHIEEARRSLLTLLEETRRSTGELLARLDPELEVHHDERAWRVRDVVGHLGVWNVEAARSLQAYANGGEYICVPSRGQYYDYNGPAADERRTWTMPQVWAEYELAHEQLRQIVASMPPERWDGEMVFPWNERGTVERFIRIMMKHESHDHCELIEKQMG